MIEIFVNLKRFEVPRGKGGICDFENPQEWMEYVIDKCIAFGIGKFSKIRVTFLLPEALILAAKNRLNSYSSDTVGALEIGSQGVFREDIKTGVNFGAFTTNFPAAAVKNLGCTWSIIGHSEERTDKLNMLASFEPAVNKDPEIYKKAHKTVGKLINQEVLCALNAGINVLICVGETAGERGEGVFAEQKSRIEAALKSQLLTGLEGVRSRLDKRKIVIGYEPVWAIGPGKVPPGGEYIEYVSKYIKNIVKQYFGFNPPVVYGGGLKEENASMLSGIETIDGGLVALTRFSGDIRFEPEDLKKIIEKYLGKLQ